MAKFSLTQSQDSTGSRRPYKKKTYSNQRSTRPRSSSTALATAPPRKIAKICDSIIHTIPCAAAFNVPYNPGGITPGFYNTSQDINFMTTQDGIYSSQNGSSWSLKGSQFNNYASLAAVFQQYRITRMDIDVYYSSNAVIQANNQQTTAFPMIYVVTDTEDAVKLTDVASALQYPSCKVFQMVAGRKHTISMVKPVAIGVMDNATTFIGTTSSAKAERSPWLTCGANGSSATAPQIPHGTFKYYVDNVLGNTGSEIGYFTFHVRVAVQYRGID